MTSFKKTVLVTLWWCQALAEIFLFSRGGAWCSHVTLLFCIPIRALLQYLAHIEKLQAVILEVREAGWVGVEADPVDLTFQDLQVFDHIHCWFAFAAP